MVWNARVGLNVGKVDCRIGGMECRGGGKNGRGEGGFFAQTRERRRINSQTLILARRLAALCPERRASGGSGCYCDTTRGAVLLPAAGRPDSMAAAPVQNMLTRSLDFQWPRTPGRRARPYSAEEIALIFPGVGTTTGRVPAIGRTDERSVQTDFIARFIRCEIRVRRGRANDRKNGAGEAERGETEVSVRALSMLGSVQAAGVDRLRRWRIKG